MLVLLKNYKLVEENYWGTNMGSALGNIVTNREKSTALKKRDRNVNNWKVVGGAKFGGGTHFYTEKDDERGIRKGGRMRITNFGN